MTNKSGDRQDPLPSFCFLIEIPGIQAFFKSVSGLKSETEAVQVKEGGANDTTFTLVGATKWSPIILRNGFTADSKLLTWRESWATGRNMKRLSGVITQLDTRLRPMGAWTFVRGWPSKWEMNEFDAAKSELSIETLEITHEGLSYKAVARPARPAPPRSSASGAKQATSTQSPAPSTRPSPHDEATSSGALGRAPSQEELVALNKARFSEIEEFEQASERGEQVEDTGSGRARAPTHDELISLGKARFPDVE
ncbi:MAG: phage tail protein [Deltaproteobacteria bacterium]|nr:phage tail protein [Deltaproteobacteria bacterium]